MTSAYPLFNNVSCLSSLRIVLHLLTNQFCNRKSYLWTVTPHEAPVQTTLAGTDLDSAVSCIRWSDDGDGVVLGHDDGKVTLWTRDGSHVFTWWPHEAPVTCVSIRGLGRAPLILSGGDCSAVSQFMPGADMQDRVATKIRFFEDFSRRPLDTGYKSK